MFEIKKSILQRIFIVALIFSQHIGAIDIDAVAELPQKPLASCINYPIFRSTNREVLLGRMGYLTTPTDPQREWWSGNQILWSNSCPGLISQCFTRAVRKADRYVSSDSLKVPLLLSVIKFRHLNESFDTLPDSLLKNIPPEEKWFSKTALPVGAKIRHNTALVLNSQFYVVDSSRILTNIAIITSKGRFQLHSEGVIYPFEMLGVGKHSVIFECTVDGIHLVTSTFVVEVLS